MNRFAPAIEDEMVFDTATDPSADDCEIQHISNSSGNSNFASSKTPRLIQKPSQLKKKKKIYQMLKKQATNDSMFSGVISSDGLSSSSHG